MVPGWFVAGRRLLDSVACLHQASAFTLAADVIVAPVAAAADPEYIESETFTGDTHSPRLT